MIGPFLAYLNFYLNYPAPEFIFLTVLAVSSSYHHCESILMSSFVFFSVDLQCCGCGVHVCLTLHADLSVSQNIVFHYP